MSEVILIGFTDVIGVQTVTTFFQRALRADRLAHAYCFYGPNDTAKAAFALALAKAIHCEQMVDDACGECRSCRQITHGNHLDVVIIRPEGSLIKIEQLRQLQRKFRYKSSSAQPRVVIIETAEKMRTEAANSLLKFLEEPVSPMIAILLTAQVHALLPTIRSRCQQIRFRSMSLELRSKQWQQQGISRELAHLFAHLHLDLSSDDTVVEEAEWQSRIDHLSRWNQLILKGQSDAILELEQPWFRQELEHKNLPLFLDLLLLWYRELIIYQESGQSALFPSWREAIKKQALSSLSERLLHHFELIMSARTHLEHTFLQHRNIIEHLLLQLTTPSLTTELALGIPATID